MCIDLNEILHNERGRGSAKQQNQGVWPTSNTHTPIIEKFKFRLMFLLSYSTVTFPIFNASLIIHGSLIHARMVIYTDGFSKMKNQLKLGIKNGKVGRTQNVNSTSFVAIRIDKFENHMSTEQAEKSILHPSCGGSGGLQYHPEFLIGTTRK